MINQEIYEKIKYNFDHIAKPIDSLGDFEDIICRIGAIQNTQQPDISKRAVIIMCADNGIVAEGISQVGSEVTYSVATNMGHSCSSVGYMGSIAKVDTIPIDIGMDSSDTPEGVINRKIRRGTRNFSIEKAMTMEELERAIEIGINCVKDAIENGYKMLATGEMGIGNTTTSAAIAAAILDLPASDVVGRGAGLDDFRLAKKMAIVDEAIDKYDLRKADVKSVLCAVGGYDIAGMVGVYLGCAIYHVPVVIDGVISAISALCAYMINSEVKDMLFASHSGREPALKYILDKLELKPIVNGNLALGEGTGAVLFFPLLDSVYEVYRNGMTFEEMSLEEYKRF